MTLGSAGIKKMWGAIYRVLILPSIQRLHAGSARLIATPGVKVHYFNVAFRLANVKLTMILQKPMSFAVSTNSSSRLTAIKDV